MPAPPPTDRNIGINLRRNLLINDSLLMFDFQPSVGIAAGRLDKFGIDIRSFREPLKRVVQQVMAPSFRKNFEREGRPDRWEPLSDATWEFRAAAGNNSEYTLQRTGLLMKTIQQLNIWTITSTNATIQSLPEKISYGNIHQQGYGGGGGSRSMKTYIAKAGGDAREAQKLLDDDLIMAMRTGQKMGSGGRQVPAIPQRQFVLVQEEDYDAITEVFHKWFRERALAQGFVMT